MKRFSSSCTLGAIVSLAVALPVQAQVCQAASSAHVPVVVELYTSEGCNSCPPADRWLSTLKRDPGVVALSFHVDYWDRLGWKDRFSSAAFTRRQGDYARRFRLASLYTPQLVVNGAQ